MKHKLIEKLNDISYIKLIDKSGAYLPTWVGYVCSINSTKLKNFETYELIDIAHTLFKIKSWKPEYDIILNILSRRKIEDKYKLEILLLQEI